MLGDPVFVSGEVARPRPVPGPGRAFQRPVRSLLPVVLTVAIGTAGVTARLPGQDTPVGCFPPDSTVRLIPGAHYKAGRLHRLILGDHHRDLWTTPLDVSVLNPSAFAGGLTTLCRGGGFQTRSLRFEARDGRQYVFRSVDKDPRTKLPELLQETFVADLLQDQISSHHPGGALVVAPLLDAVGVLNVQPQLVVMPDDSMLGEYRGDFADLLGLIEERPRDAPGGKPGFANSVKIEGTEYVWDRVESSPEDRIDATAYLTARLVDVLVGDWDRHHDQWKWARFPDGDGYLWQPIPRDRDQAFSRLDGLILSIGRYYLPELVSFGDEYPSAFGLTWTGRALDRRFLSELEWPAWESVVGAMQSRLTDAVIDSAVLRLPPEYHDSNGQDIARALHHRRDDLLQFANRYYRLLAREVDIHTTDEDERAVVTRGTEQVRVVIWSSTDADTSAAYFTRTFDADVTKEIRIYLHGGDDHAIVRGRAGRGLVVRVVGGGGDDVLVDSTTGGAYTAFYDHRGDNTFVKGGKTKVDRHEFRPPPRTDFTAPRPPGSCGDSIPELAARDLADPFTDWGITWFPAPTVTVSPDLGLFISAGAIRTRNAFQKAPYGSQIDFRAGYATGAGRFRLLYDADFRELRRKVGASMYLRYSGIEIIRYHGFGNETELTAPNEFYKTTQRQFEVAPAMTVFPVPHLRFALGPVLHHANTVLGQGNFIDIERPYGASAFGQIGARVTVDLDSRDLRAAATRGVHLTGGAALYPALWDVLSTYGAVFAEGATYLTWRVPREMTLALRVGGKKVWGDPPYHEAAFLGGASTVRGYAEQRFAGNAAVYGNAELRTPLTRVSLFLPGELGVFALGDVGRVFQAGETSNQWHGAAGGGLWFAFIERSTTLSLAVAQSDEQRSIYVRAGFMF